MPSSPLKRWRWLFALGGLLLFVSLAFYALHYLFFRDARRLFVDLLDNLAFLPVQVLIVALIINQLLVGREKRDKLHKLNMVIDAFFSEAGISLLKQLAGFDAAVTELQGLLQLKPGWRAENYKRALQELGHYADRIDSRRSNLDELKSFLQARRNFLLMLLENPNLLEHELFTDLLWAVFHLAEELGFRPGFANLPPTDLDHLSQDIKRAYRLLIREWLTYMRHLQADYPYLFSLSLRVNPFDRQAEVIIRGQGK